VLCEACPRSTILGGIEGSGGTLHKSLHQASRAALGTKVPWSRLDRQKRPPGEIDGPRLCRVEGISLPGPQHGNPAACPIAQAQRPA